MFVCGGGTWLYYQVRTVETQLLMDGITAALEPLTRKLGAIDAVSAMQQREPWLIADVQAFFAAIPSLRNISVRGPDVGVQLVVDGGGGVTSHAVSALPAGSQRAKIDSRVAQRLHNESGASFLLSFDLTRAPEPPVRLDFADPVLSKQGLGIDLDIKPDLPRVRARKASVRDALLNVLINAGQSGQKSGAVRVTAESCGDAIRVVIEDQGQGIPEQHVPRLFDAFYTTRE
jgi:hypothetical protein